MGAKCKCMLVLFFLLTILGLPMKAYAHGVEIQYESSVSIEIVATYDNGEPMAGAQVMIYAPDAPSSPWMIGACDDEGRFTFTPDLSKPGTWDVQIRKAGHGDIVHIPVGEEVAATGGTGGYSEPQIVLMSVCVVWGIAGTALYVKRRRA